MGRVFQPKLKSGKPSRKWVIVYRANGRRVWENTGLTDERKAKQVLKQREGAAASGTPVLPRVEKVRYDEVEDDLRKHYEATGKRDLAEYTYRVKHLTKFFAGKRIAAIGQPEVDRYILQRQEEGAAGATIRRELGTLGKMLRLAYENRKLLRMPVIHKPEEGSARSGFFEREQFEAVRRALRPDLQVVVTLAHTYGWRKDEILSLERRQVDLDVGTVRLDPGSTKNDEGRVAYLTPELVHLFTEQLARVDALQKSLGRIIPYVFPHLHGHHRGKRPRDFRKAWATACRRAGLATVEIVREAPRKKVKVRPLKIPHDFRRTAVRNMEKAGVPRSVAMKLTGHKTESVYRRYAIVSDADLQEAARRLGGAFSGAFSSGTQKPAAQVAIIKGTGG